uniref:Uncharacterized protein n=1 Tax=uncultured marine virus TaxID=186617 RepID=A0A0F7L735_9VIRU|nr:hypothetical protein [uncultured marine virus]
MVEFRHSLSCVVSQLDHLQVFSIPCSSINSIRACLWARDCDLESLISPV